MNMHTKATINMIRKIFDKAVKEHNIENHNIELLEEALLSTLEGHKGIETMNIIHVCSALSSLKVYLLRANYAGEQKVLFQELINCFKSEMDYCGGSVEATEVIHMPPKGSMH